MSFLSNVPEDEKTRTERKPASQYFLLDSAHRNQNSSLANKVIAVYGQQTPPPVPWNEFKLQKPAELMSAFARRITVSEVQFPWSIPNITPKNNTIWWFSQAEPNVSALSVEPGFYTPDELVDAFNAAALAAIPPAPFTLAYDNIAQTYSLTTPDIADNVVVFYNQPQGTPPDLTYLNNFDSAPSLWKTLGFTERQAGVFLIGQVTPGPTDSGTITGNPTLTQYTSYVDILSEKLMYYTDVRDGESSRNNTHTGVVCRLYASNEVSQPYSADPITSRPFVIHRQFKNPKQVQWNPTAFIDWIDIRVVDEYGDLVPLPQISVADQIDTLEDGAYPDFQITMLASEN